MNFDKLATIWNSTDRDIDAAVRINKELVMKLGLRRVRSSLYEIKWTAVIHIVVGVLFFLFLNGFIVTHFSMPRFLIPALLLQAITIYSLVFEAIRLSLYYTVDSAASVIVAQKKLARLKKMEALDTYSLLLIIPLFSAPFLIVIAWAAARVDLYTFNIAWLAYHTVGSLVVAAIIVFFLKFFPDKKLRESESFLRELKDTEE